VSDPQVEMAWSWKTLMLGTVQVLGLLVLLARKGTWLPDESSSFPRTFSAGQRHLQGVAQPDRQRHQAPVASRQGTRSIFRYLQTGLVNSRNL